MKDAYLSKAARVAAGISCLIFLGIITGPEYGLYAKWNTGINFLIGMFGLFLFALALMLCLVKTPSTAHRALKRLCFSAPVCLIILGALPLFIVAPPENGLLLTLGEHGTHIIEGVEFQWVPNTVAEMYATHVVTNDSLGIRATFRPKPENILQLHEHYGSAKNYYAACDLELQRRLHEAQVATNESHRWECFLCAFDTQPWMQAAVLVQYSEIEVSYTRQIT